MSEWYYARSNQPRGPVSEAELRRMADSGELAPSELVWKDGMAEWTRASAAMELFPDGAPNPVATPARPRRDDYTDDDFGPRGRDPRQRDPFRRGLSTGAKVGIILSVAGGAVAIGVVSLVLILTLSGGSGSGTYTVNLKKDDVRSEFITFPANCDVEVVVRSEVTHPDTDVDLSILEDRDGREVAFDRSPSKDCVARLHVPVAKRYEIRLENLGEGSARCLVTYKSIPRRK